MIINYLLISNAHIIQEWQCIVNTATTENQNQRNFFTTEIDVYTHLTSISKCNTNII